MNKILIVDDSRMILQVAKDLIVRNEPDIEVTTEVNPTKAKGLILEGTYNVIILDIIMPEISGLDLLKWIRQEQKFDQIKVIMFTSLDDSSALADCFASGAYDFISKPLDEHEFLARLRHALEEYKLQVELLNNYEELSLKKSSLEALNKQLQVTQSELINSERLAGIGYLAAGMAHEINNPLGYITSNITTLQNNMEEVLNMYMDIRSDLLSKPEYQTLNASIDLMEEAISFDFVNEDSLEIFEDIKSGTSRIKTIINALRNFSSVDSMGENELIDLREVIDDILCLLNSRLEARIEVEVNTEAVASVFGYKSDVNLSLLNLVNNSIEAIDNQGPDHKGHIWIHTYERDGYLYVEIEDDGVGMSGEVQQHAVDPFFTTKDVGKGTGLGLSTAYNCFVNVMKGKMKINSNINEGTKVTLSLPINGGL